MANNRVFAFFQMAPPVGKDLLTFQLSKPQHSHKQYVWMVRFSKEDGMLTLHVATRIGNGETVSYLRRYAVTNIGWEMATFFNLADVRSRMRKDVQITNENISEFIQSLVEQAMKDTPGLELDIDNLIIPDNGLLTSQTHRVEYLEIINQQTIVTIKDHELLKLISCPSTNLMMIDPVITADGRVCDQSAMGEDQVLGVHYFPNHTLRNVIKYIATIFSSDASVALRQSKLENLENDLTDPVLAELMLDAVLLRSGHCFHRETVARLFGEEEQRHIALCPKTQSQIFRGMEITDNITSSIAAKFPEIKKEVELLIEEQKKSEAMALKNTITLS